MLLDNKTICGVLISSLKPNSGKRIKYKCDKCTKHGETTFQSYNKGQRRNGDSGKTYCQPCATSLVNWKGGIQWTEDGYKNIRVAKGKYKREHRLVIEQHLGRNLKSTEIVHHIDEDKLNNQLENLDLCKNKSVHQKAHHSLEIIGLELFKAGFVKYDRKTHTYYVAHQKLRELLGHPEVDNQQPSLKSDLSEGSTTSSNDVINIMKDHERAAVKKTDDIV